MYCKIKMIFKELGHVMFLGIGLAMGIVNACP